MISKNTLNLAHLLLSLLFTAILLDPLFANAQSKAFEISKTHASSKAIVSSSDKKIEVKLAFNSNNYNDGHSFGLSVGGCTLQIKARKNPRDNGVNFDFYNGKTSKIIGNPMSFSIQEQRLVFKSSNDASINYVECNQEINFVSIDGGQSTIELSLTGDDLPTDLILSSDNLAYDDESTESKAKANVWLFVGIGVGIFVALLLIVASIFVVICIKRMKQKIVGKKSKEQVKTAISAEISTAKEVSKEQTSSVKDSKPAKPAPRNEKQNVEKDLNTNALKAEKDQKLGAQEEQLIEVPENYPYPKYFIRKGPVLTKEQIAKREHYRKLYYESLKNNPGTLARANEENGVDIEVLALRASQEENAFIKAMEEKDAANERAKAQEQKFN